MPKLLVAPQTRVVEVVVDEAGAWLPGVPLVAVLAPPDRLLGAGRRAGRARR